MSLSLCFVIPVGVFALGLLVAFLRRGSVSGTAMGFRRRELFSPAAPPEVFARLVQMVGHHRVDDADASSNMLVLSSPPTMGTWGFLYPVIIHPAAGGGSRIEIGCRSKVIQLGPLVTRAHKQCVEAVKLLVGLPEARVA